MAPGCKCVLLRREEQKASGHCLQALGLILADEDLPETRQPPDLSGKDGKHSCVGNQPKCCRRS